MPDPITLTGRIVTLEPLTLEHVPALVEAAATLVGDPPFSYVPQGEADAEAYVFDAMQLQSTGDALPFAIVRNDGGAVVGTTRFTRIEYWNWPATHPMRRPRDLPDATAIGYTWISTGAQRTGANREAKWLMLVHAFESWRVHRVSMRADARNDQSRRALEALGASFEGVRRAETLGADGTIRDSAYYSIVATEWPEVKAALAQRIRVPA